MTSKSNMNGYENQKLIIGIHDIGGVFNKITREEVNGKEIYVYESELIDDDVLKKSVFGSHKIPSYTDLHPINCYGSIYSPGDRVSLFRPIIHCLKDFLKTYGWEDENKYSPVNLEEYLKDSKDLRSLTKRGVDLVDRLNIVLAWDEKCQEEDLENKNFIYWHRVFGYDDMLENIYCYIPLRVDGKVVRLLYFSIELVVVNLIQPKENINELHQFLNSSFKDESN